MELTTLLQWGLTLATMIVLPIASAGLTDLYSFCLGDPAKKEGPKRGRIFSRAGLWMHERYIAFETVTREVQASKMRLATTEEELKRAKRCDRVNPYKLLGMCPRCTGVWISAGVFVAAHVAWPMSWWLLVLHIPLASIALGYAAKWR